MYQLAIIGGGPGGMAAGIYAARKKIKTVLVTDLFGGQSINSPDIQNWIGTLSISGYDLAKSMEAHLRSHGEAIDIIEGSRVTKIDKIEGGYSIKMDSDKSIEAKYILLSSGSRRKKLGIPGEERLDGRGVVYCSICDAPLFKNKTVAVVGGGNAGVEAVVDLLPYAKEIYLLSRGPALKADPVTVEKISNHPNVHILTESVPTEIVGENSVSALKYKDAAGEEKELAVQGVFVEIGALPNSEFVKDVVNLNERGEVVVDHKTQQTSDSGIWAVGDVSDVLYKQNNISAGDGVKALLNIYDRLIKSQ